MRVHLSTLILGVAVLAAAVASAAFAQESATHEFAGFTSLVGPGSTGVLEMTSRCQSDFGSDARMCNSVEVMRTTTIPDAANVVGWVRPVLRGDGTSVYDASGVTGAELSCGGWASFSSTVTGLSMSKEGSLFLSGCSAQYPAACCVPIPEPTMAHVPALLPLARGILVGMLMLGVGMAVLARRVALLKNGPSRPRLRG